jgi:hypothetical protein
MNDNKHTIILCDIQGCWNPASTQPKVQAPQQTVPPQSKKTSKKQSKKASAVKAQPHPAPESTKLCQWQCDG